MDIKILTGGKFATKEHLTPEGKHTQFYVWSGWLKNTRDGTLRAQDLYTYPHTVCLLLLAGF